MKLGLKERFAYALGAVGKDMAYALASGYVLYYYQDVLGVDAWIMGIILLAARIIDALNAPIMGVVVAKTHTRHGRFHPWMLVGMFLYRRKYILTDEKMETITQELKEAEG